MKIRNEWTTPIEFRQWVVKETSGMRLLDVAATKENFFGHSYLEDSLNKNWIHSQCEGVWCNPPYSEPEKWIEKAIEQKEKYSNLFIFMLLKCDPSTKWFKKLILAQAKITFLSPRIQFDPPKGVKKSSNNFASIFVELSNVEIDYYLYYKVWK